MECPVCGKKNSDAAQLCVSCGAHLGADFAPGSLLSPGTQLSGGDYSIEKNLGRGGMGAVYLATVNSSGRKCAIKELRDDILSNRDRQQAVRNFQRETRILRSLYHVSIPEFYGSFTEGRKHFLVMEYVEGRDLEQGMSLREQGGKVLRNGTALSWQQVVKYAIQICDVLSYLHKHIPDPIIYRDMKPGNVLITSDGQRLVLTDFGIARFFARRARGTAIGTPGYIPPEQYTGTVDPRSDLYALAATMHHLLTDQAPDMFPPFKLPRVRTLLPEIPAWLDNIIAINLREDILERYDSAEQLRRDLTLKMVTKTSNCPQCRLRNPPGSAYCDRCSHPLSQVTIACHRCSTANVINSRFCINCGNLL